MTTGPVVTDRPGICWGRKPTKRAASFLAVGGLGHLLSAGRDAALSRGDAVASMVLGVPVRVRLSVSPRVLKARIDSLHATLRDVRILDVQLVAADVYCENLGLRLWPLPVRISARRLVIQAVLAQEEVDRLVRSTGLPVRIMLRDGALRARTGIAGWPVGDADLVVELEHRAIRMKLVRTSVLGIPFESVALLPPLVVPLPNLPKGISLMGIEPADRSVRVILRLDRLDEPITPENVQRAVRLLRSDPSGSA